MKLSPKAKTMWEKIPPSIRLKLLNNVYCTSCSKMRGIGRVNGSVVKGDLVLRGVCTDCTGDVARLIESA